MKEMSEFLLRIAPKNGILLKEVRAFRDRPPFCIPGIPDISVRARAGAALRPGFGFGARAGAVLHAAPGHAGAAARRALSQKTVSTNKANKRSKQQEREYFFMSTLGKKTVEDLRVKGKNVLVRCDFNVPMKDGKITNDNRIVAALPTIQKLIENGGRVVLCSHLGKPKNGPEEKFSLAPVAVRLSELLGKQVVFANDDNVTGENAKAAAAAMQDGDVVLLQNTRFRKEETKNLPEFSKDLADLVGENSAYVNEIGRAHV